MGGDAAETAGTRIVRRMRFCAPSRLRNTFACLVVTVILAEVGGWATSRAAEIPGVADFITSHCLDCHSGDHPEAGLPLDRLDNSLSDTATLGRWEAIHDRVARGEMPPADAPQPPPAERQRFVAALNRSLTDASRAQQAAHGRVRLRRLNRREYEHTLRDLLALPHLEVSGMLPPDQTAHGFDTVGSALELSHVHMARYLDAARYALDKAIVLAPPPEPTTTFLEARTNGRLQQVLKKQREAVAVGDAVGLLRQPNTAQAPWWWSKFAPPIDGRYRIRMKSFGFVWDRGQILPAERTHVVTLHAVSGTTKRPLGTFDMGRTADSATIHDFTTFLRQGDQLQMWFETLDDRNKGNTKLSDYTAPGVAVEWLEVEGPFVETPPSAATRRLFGDLPVAPWSDETGLQEPPVPVIVSGVGKRARREPAKRNKVTLYHVVSEQPHRDAERLLIRFAEQAFRRPVQPDELQDILDLVHAKLDRTFCFQEALRTGFQAALCSPEFLFLQEEPGPLDDFAVAARLSYFLWSSLPDEELRSAAEQGVLHDPAELRRQVDRMLDDPRSERFVTSFCGQWLDLDRITVTQPDEQLYPEFDQWLLDSMVQETHAYVTEMLRRDLGAAALVDSDFLMVNGRLAALYGLPDVDGVTLRPVRLPADSPRGGLLTQASILKVTANGTTTSPVTRGAWVLDRIFGQPSPLPPANVPAIKPDVRGTTTIREQLRQHRNDDACAVCHRRIDPPGFALESFDVIGGWRDRYRALGEGDIPDATLKDGRPVTYRLGQPVDPSGVTPGGQPFRNIHEFRTFLLSRRHQLARNLVERLLTYATGAAPQFADREIVEQILERTEDSGFGLRSLIHAVVRSDAFLRK